MAIRVVIEKSCDICGLTVSEKDSRTITSVRISFNKGEYEVDACESCFDGDPFTKAMRMVKRAYAKGTKPVAPTAPDGTVDMACGFPGCDYVGPRLQSLNAHRTKAGHWGKAKR
jgi:hypothetical protein